MMTDNKIYRPCVGIALFNKDGHVFIGERIDTPSAWQMPQGGIDEGEDIKAAALRELKEETGVHNVEIISVAKELIRYDLPEHLQNKLWNGIFAGQEQTWVAARFLGDDHEIDIKAFDPPEFSDWKWVPLEDTLNHIVPFKRDVYQRVISLFSDIT
ncbi:MAG: RNA pyrophosphohydrolase [Bdellovibrionales bacterium]